MQEIASDGEIQRAAEIRGKPQFLRELVSVFLRDVFAYQPRRAAQLRIAKLSVVSHKAGDTRAVAGKNAWRGVDPIIIFRRVQAVFVVSGLRCERQLAVDIVIDAELERVVFRGVFGIEQRIDISQALRLNDAAIRIYEIGNKDDERARK